MLIRLHLVQFENVLYVPLKNLTFGHFRLNC